MTMTEATHATDPRLSAAKASWQAPTSEVLPVSETATGPAAVSMDGLGGSPGS